jgi:hypothetical protein
MSDRETIIKSLGKIERRVRTNRLFRDLSVGFFLFLLFPLAFKIWDLLSPFRGTTVTVALLVWVSLLAVYSLTRILQIGTLEETAAQLDKKIGLCDELKTAYWFITHPRTSEWIDLQLRRASTRVSQLSIDRLYPRVIPPTSYLAAALFALIIGLNFLPLRSNHNWFYLQAAPAFSLTDAEQALLAQARQLLERTDQLNKTDLAARIEQIMKDLQEGKIDPAEAIKELEEIQKLLDATNLDTAAIDKKLNELAQDSKASEELKDAAEALQGENLEDAAAKMKEAAQELEAAADSLKNQDQEAAAKALQGAVYLKELADKLQDQEFKEQAAKDVQSLAQSLQNRITNPQQAATEGEAKESGQKDGETQSGLESADGDDTDGAPTEGSGGAPPTVQDSGRPRKDAAREGPPTEKLEVQLQQEQLTGQYDQEGNSEGIEQTSKQERSKLDYRNVPTQLSAAERDVLIQKQIPWEYRTLIKQYFAAIQPRKKN